MLKLLLIAAAVAFGLILVALAAVWWAMDIDGPNTDGIS